MADSEQRTAMTILPASLEELLGVALTDVQVELRTRIARAWWDVEVKCGRASPSSDLEEILNAAWDQLDAAFPLLLAAIRREDCAGLERTGEE